MHHQNLSVSTSSHLDSAEYETLISCKIRDGVLQNSGLDPDRNHDPPVLMHMPIAAVIESARREIVSLKLLPTNRFKSEGVAVLFSTGGLARYHGPS
jgi:hypothetical protein